MVVIKYWNGSEWVLIESKTLNTYSPKSTPDAGSLVLRDADGVVYAGKHLIIKGNNVGNANISSIKFLNSNSTLLGEIGDSETDGTDINIKSAGSIGIKPTGEVIFKPVNNGVNSFTFRDKDNNKVLGIDTTNRRLGVNLDNPSYALDINGSARVSGNLYLGSGIATYLAFGTGDKIVTNNAIVTASSVTAEYLILNNAPTLDSHGTTKSYVDSLINSRDFKQSVRVATASALPTCSYSAQNKRLTGSGTLAVDGVTLSVNDRVLVKDQVTGSQNGIYYVTQNSAGVWTLDRAVDFITLTPGALLYVEEGSVNTKSVWFMNNTGTITLDSTSLSFTQAYGNGTDLLGRSLKVQNQGNFGTTTRLVENSITATGALDSISVTGFKNTVTMSGSSGANAMMYGIDNFVSNNVGSGALAGISLMDNCMESTKDIGIVRGINSILSISGGSVTNSIYGYSCEIQALSGSVAIVKAIGLYINYTGNSAKYTGDKYGFYISNEKYNYLSAGLGIGDTAGLYPLSVKKAVTASLGVGYAVNIENTLTASANNDTLAALWISPTFNDNGKSSVKKYGVVVLNGNSGFGTGTPTERLEVAGNILASGNIVNTGSLVSFGLTVVPAVNSDGFVHITDKDSNSILKVNSVNRKVTLGGALNVGGNTGITGLLSTQSVLTITNNLSNNATYGMSSIDFKDKDGNMVAQLTVDCDGESKGNTYLDNFLGGSLNLHSTLFPDTYKVYISGAEVITAGNISNYTTPIDYNTLDARYMKKTDSIISVTNKIAVAVDTTDGLSLTTSVEGKGGITITNTSTYGRSYNISAGNNGTLALKDITGNAYLTIWSGSTLFHYGPVDISDTIRCQTSLSIIGPTSSAPRLEFWNDKGEKYGYLKAFSYDVNKDMALHAYGNLFISAALGHAYFNGNEIVTEGNFDTYMANAGYNYTTLDARYAKKDLSNVSTIDADTVGGLAPGQIPSYAYDPVGVAVGQMWIRTDL